MFTIHRTIATAFTTAITTTAAAVTFVAPAAAIPVDIPAPPTVTDADADTVTVERPCYMARPGWNTPAGWEQPVCQTEVRARVVDPVPAVRRPGVDFMP